MNEWKPGLPPGKYYPGEELEYEVVYTVIGTVWHRRREAEPRTLAQITAPIVESLKP